MVPLTVTAAFSRTGVSSLERRLLSSVLLPRLRGPSAFDGITGQRGNDDRCRTGAARGQSSATLGARRDRSRRLRRRRLVVPARPDERHDGSRGRGADGDRHPPQLDHAGLRLLRSARLVAPARKPLRPPHDRRGFRELRGHAFVDYERHHVHARPVARPGRARAVPPRVPGVSERASAAGIRALARNRRLRGGDRVRDRPDDVRPRLRTAQPVGGRREAGGGRRRRPGAVRIRGRPVPDGGRRAGSAEIACGPAAAPLPCAAHRLLRPRARDDRRALPDAGVRRPVRARNPVGGADHARARAGCLPDRTAPRPAGALGRRRPRRRAAGRARPARSSRCARASASRSVPDARVLAPRVRDLRRSPTVARWTYPSSRVRERPR